MTDVSRALLADLYDAAVRGAAPFPGTRNAVAAWLAAARARPSPMGPPATRVHVIATGKAAEAMFSGAAQAIADADLELVGGVIVSATHSTHPASQFAAAPARVRAVVGDHPVPGPGSLDAGDAIETAVQNVAEGDVVIVLVSGGTSALAAAPVAALSQAIGDEARAQAHIANLAETLLESGLAIGEMNAIRRRVLRWGAGRLAVALYARGASAIATFAISDVIGDDPAVIGSGPCSPDPLDDASFLALVDAHDVRGSVERSMGLFLGIFGAGSVPAVPPPSHPAFARVHYQLVAGNADAVTALASAARLRGVSDIVIEAEPLAGDAASLGDRLARRALLAARDVLRGEQVLFIAGGEPVVNLRETLERAWATSENDDGAVAVVDEPMRGGRMQVLALAASLALEAASAHGNRDAWRIRMLAAGTDGRDGPTDAAGAIIDSAVPALARRAGREPERDIETGRSYYPLDAAGALLKPGPTGTNVMDIVAILIG